MVLSPPPLGVRAEVSTDRVDVGRVTRAAFGSHGEVVAELVAALQASGAYAGHSYVAVEAGDHVIGHVLLSRGWVDAPDRLVDVLVLSPLSVHPEHQRRGVGRALVGHALAAAESAGAPAVFLEGDPAYYRRLGFVPAGALGFGRPSLRIPEAAFQVFTLATYDGSVTGALVYPDPFWRLDCVGLR